MRTIVAEMVQRKVAAVLPASKSTMKFVLEKKPTFLELYNYAEDLDDPKEKEVLQEWALHACQTAPGNNSRRPSSILAHNFEPVLGASAELEELLVSRLDQTIGQAAPVATPPRQLATDASIVAERHARDRESEMVRAMKSAFEEKRPKEKFTELFKDRWAGYSGVSEWEECAPAMRRLEKHYGNVEDAVQFIEAELNATATRLNLRLTGLNVTPDFARAMLKGQVIPTGATRPVARSVHKGISHLSFLPWTAVEREEYTRKQRAKEESKGTRSFDQAEELESLGSREAPSTYNLSCRCIEGYLVWCETWLTAKSDLTSQYWDLHETMLSLADEEHNITTQTWLNLSWMLLINNYQFFAIKTSLDDLYSKERLPTSVLHPVMQSLRLFNTVQTPACLPSEWLLAVSKKRKREISREEKIGGFEGGIIPHDETHPKVKEMMREYYSLHDYIMGKAICTKAGGGVYPHAQTSQGCGGNRETSHAIVQ